jgi:hypothetical protein
MGLLMLLPQQTSQPLILPFASALSLGTGDKDVALLELSGACVAHPLTQKGKTGFTGHTRLEALRKVWVPLFTVTTEDHWIELS